MSDLKTGATSDSSAAEVGKIVNELHSYSRHNMMLWVQWFTFFITVNYLALGWFAGEIAKGELKSARPLVYVSVLFILQGSLGVWVSLIWRKHLLKTGNDLSSLYARMLSSSDSPDFPHHAYGSSIVLGVIALVVVIGVWLAFLIRH